MAPTQKIQGHVVEHVLIELFDDIRPVFSALLSVSAGKEGQEISHALVSLLG